MNLVSATTRDETPTFFPAGDELLFGILTSPTTDQRGVAVVILPGGGTPLSTNINRLSVRLCRGLAAAGFHAFRFDYHGVGESMGVASRFRLDQPFVMDLEGALEWLRSQGIERFVLVGSCFGGRTVLSAANRTEGVEAVVLVSLPVRDFEMGERVPTGLASRVTLSGFVRRGMSLRVLRGLWDSRRRRDYVRAVRAKLRQIRSRQGGSSPQTLEPYSVSTSFLEPLRSLVERKVPVLIVYGDADDLFAEFEDAKSGELGELLSRAGEEVTITITPGYAHGFRRVETQDQVLDIITSWVSQIAVGVPH